MARLVYVGVLVACLMAPHAFAQPETPAEIAKKLEAFPDDAVDPAIRYLQQQVTEAEAAFGADDVRVAQYYDILAGVAQSYRRLDLAAASARAEIRLLSGKTGQAMAGQAKAVQDKALATAYGGLGNILAASGNPSEAIAAAQQALPLFAQAYGPQSLEVANGLLNQANILKALDRRQEALAALQKATELFGVNAVPHSPDALYALEFSAALLSGLDRDGEALDLYVAASDARKTDPAQKPADVLSTLQSVATLLHRLGRLPEAADYERQILNLAETLPDKMVAAQAAADLAETLHALDRPVETTKTVARALASWAAADGSDDATFAATEETLIRSLIRSGRRADLLPVLLQKTDRLRPLKDQQPLRFETALARVGAHYAWAGDFDRALPYEREALGLARTINTPALLAEALSNLANVLRSADSRAEKIDLLEEARGLYASGPAQDAGQLLASQIRLARAYAAARRPADTLRVAQPALAEARNAGNPALKDIVSLMDSISDALKLTHDTAALEANDDAILKLAGQASLGGLTDVADYVMRESDSALERRDYARLLKLSDKAIAAYAGLQRPADIASFHTARIYRLDAQLQLAGSDGLAAAHEAERGAFTLALAQDEALLQQVFVLWSGAQIRLSEKLRERTPEQALALTDSLLDRLAGTPLKGSKSWREARFERSFCLKKLFRFSEARSELDLDIAEASLRSDAAEVAETRVNAATVLSDNNEYFGASLNDIDSAIAFYVTAPQAYGRELNTSRIFRALILKEQHKYDAALDDMPAIISATFDLYGDDSWEFRRARDLEASIAFSRGDIATAERIWRLAVNTIPQGDVERLMQNASAITGLSTLLHNGNRYADSVALLSTMLGSLQAHGQGASALALKLLHYRSVSLRASGYANEADHDLSQALDLIEGRPEADTNLMADMLNSFASYQSFSASPAKLEPVYRRILAIRERINGTDHPWNVGALLDLTANRDAMGDSKEALDLTVRATKQFELLRLSGADVSNMLIVSADIMLSNGFDALAEKVLTRYLPEAGHWDAEMQAAALRLRGTAILRQHRPLEGMADEREALRILQAMPQQNAKALRFSFNQVARFAYDAGYRGEALDYGRRAIAMTTTELLAMQGDKDDGRRTSSLKSSGYAYRTVINAAWDIAHGAARTPPDVAPQPETSSFRQ